jgi:hypothetical protein
MRSLQTQSDGLIPYINDQTLVRLKITEGREIMKRRIPLVLILCALSGVIALGQTSGGTGSTGGTSDREISGRGTPGYVPLFVGTSKIGNSGIFESINGNIGIGTTTPLFPLHIFSDNTLPPPGQDSPVTLFVETPVSVNSGCASCAIIGIEGLASTASPSASVIGVDGVTFSPSGIGVLGNHPVVDGGGGGGVLGLTNATNGFAYAIRGDALG